MPLEQPDVQGETNNFSFQTAFTQAGQETPEPVTPVVEQVPETVVEPPVPIEEAPPTPSEFARIATEAGLSIDGLSDVDIARELATNYQKLKPYADYGQQLAPYSDQINEYFAAQAKQESQKQQAAPEAKDDWDPNGYFKQKWAGPEWSDEWEYAEKHGIVQRNPESGLYEPVPGREVMAGQVVNSMNQALLARQQQWQQITQGNPYKQFYDVLYEPMQKAWQSDVQKHIEQFMAQRETQSFVDRFENENSNWIYQKAPDGKMLMSDQGRAFYDAIGQLQQAGVSDPKTIVNLATKMVRTPAAAAVVPQAVEQVVETPVSPVQASAEKQTSFLENAMEKARHSPSAGGYTQAAPDHPVNVSETELNSMFVSDFRRAGATGA